ncbi:Monodehydroascorbate reductase (NADH) protein [Dioscorea alata]|uniref:Monodehydroascorbate reductase (NADH) protein n=1 Tax=Dioscorea alata TaxID=55571 RepID=A0ACB7U840_DIOAL|nr:Monodehydroascorbate reductase (NADH) protein [Dioscorea alata]
MAVSLRPGMSLSGSCYDNGLETKKKSSVFPLDQSMALKTELKGRQVAVIDDRNQNQRKMSICVPRVLRWWEKTTSSNMIEIKCAQELVDALINAGDKLVIVDFYSPGCGGCKALHPKICQIAELNPDAQFLKVNYEELKPMCHKLHIHVLPFFRFYRGSQGLVCSFSCTNATINKFKNALAKHGKDQSNSSSIGPAKGLEVKELLSLASSGEIDQLSYSLSSSM